MLPHTSRGPWAGIDAAGRRSGPQPAAEALQSQVPGSALLRPGLLAVIAASDAPRPAVLVSLAPLVDFCRGSLIDCAIVTQTHAKR